MPCKFIKSRWWCREDSFSAVLRRRVCRVTALMFASSLSGAPLAASRLAGRSRSTHSPYRECEGLQHSRLQPSARATQQPNQLQRLPCLYKHRVNRRCPSLVVQAQKGQPDPPDAPREERRGGREWLQTLLSRFGPITQKAENTAVLDFEKPLVELDNRITEVRLFPEVSNSKVRKQYRTQKRAAGS